MEAILLGTGPSEGMPAPLCDCTYCDTKKRSRPSLLVTDKDNNNYLFDVGPDVTMQLHSNDIHNLDGIFITHFHFDHSNGLRELYNTTIRLDVLGVEDKAPDHIASYLGKEFDIYGSPFTHDKLGDEIAYALDGHGFNAKITENDTVSLDNLEVTSFITEHSRGYIGFVIESETHKLVYTPDHGVMRTDLEFNDVDTLVYDAGALIGYEVHGSESDFKSAISRINPDETYFTNVSEHTVQKSTEELREMIDIENAEIVEDNFRII